MEKNSFLIIAILLLSAGSFTPARAQIAPEISFETLPALQVTTPKPGSSYVPGDFTGNGTSDLLWFNPELSQVGYWEMLAKPPADVPYDSSVRRIGIKTFNVTPGYFVAAVGDFNNDSYADLVFTSENRDLWLWENNKNGGFVSKYVGTYPEGWKLIGAGDVDGDGYDDLLWLNTGTCEFGYWTMRDSVQTGYKIIPIDCGYYPVGLGYFSPLNRISILWSSKNKDLYIWDSREVGFKAYKIDAYNAYPFEDMSGVWAIGGGYMGTNIGVERAGLGKYFGRDFDADGNQVMMAYGSIWTGPNYRSVDSGGYIIKGGEDNATGLYLIDSERSFICIGGISAEPSIIYGNAPAGCGGGEGGWFYPSGWWVIGAPATNKVFTNPHQLY